MDDPDLQPERLEVQHGAHQAGALDLGARDDGHVLLAGGVRPFAFTCVLSRSRTPVRIHVRARSRSHPRQHRVFA